MDFFVSTALIFTGLKLVLQKNQELIAEPMILQLELISKQFHRIP
jgi:hypothetical protein